MFNLFNLKESVKMIVALSDRRRKIHTIIEDRRDEKQKSRSVVDSDGIYIAAQVRVIPSVERFDQQAVISQSLNSFNLNMKC